MSKLTPSQVTEIRSLLEERNLTQKEIAEKVGRSRSLISDIATNRAYPLPTKINHNPTDARILSLEAENVLLKDERNAERKKAVANAKYKGIFQALADRLETSIVQIVPLPKVRSKLSKTPKNAITEHCVMHLSDGHHDQVVRPHECGGLENYDFSVSSCRAERYVDTVIKWTQQTMKPHFCFTDLWILAYGDHTSGEIHGHVNRSYFKNQFDNTIAIGKLHALMFRDLAPYFERVHVVYVPGNHGRRSIKKDYHGAHDNWDYLVGRIAELYCKDMDNVDFLIPDAFSATLDINGIGFHIFHGDDITGYLGIPYYGLQRKQQNLRAVGSMQKGPTVRYFCCGHFHKPATIGDLNGELIVNGPWVGSDSYVFNRFAGYTEPSQWLHGVHKDRGISWRLNVQLRNPNERKRPQRYCCDNR